MIAAPAVLPGVVAVTGGASPASWAEVVGRGLTIMALLTLGCVVMTPSSLRRGGGITLTVSPWFKLDFCAYIREILFTSDSRSVIRAHSVGRPFSSLWMRASQSSLISCSA